MEERECQCPSGLYLISTLGRKPEPCASVVMCQCPLGLIPHFYRVVYIDSSFGEMIVSMPSRAYTSFLQGPSMSEQMIRRSVSMPSRAYTSFLRYPFKNLGFMRFPEPVFAGIYQNILTTAVFRAC